MVARCVLPESLSHGTFFSPRVCLSRSSLRQPRSLTLRAGATRTEGPSSHQNTRRRTTPPRSFSQCGIRRSMLQRGDEPRNPWASVIEGPSRHRAQHNQHSGRPERGHTRVERNAAGRHTQSHSEATPTSSFVVGATWCALAWSRLLAEASCWPYSCHRWVWACRLALCAGIAAPRRGGLDWFLSH